MNFVGECVWRVPFGLSFPRGASAPPQTRTPGSTALIASYTGASSARYAGAAAFDPSGLNCGSQKRLRFGSLPTITSSSGRHRLHEGGGVLRELGARLRGERCRPRAGLVDGHVHAHSGELGGAGHRAQHLQLVVRRREVTGQPLGGDAHRGEPRQPQQAHPHLRDDGIRLLDRVLGDAERHRRAAGVSRSGERESGRERAAGEQVPPHGPDTLAGMADPLREQLRALPKGPGVYLFHGDRDEVLYIGKAKGLRARVRTYWNRGDTRAGIERMVERVRRIEVIVTRTEAEALHLEQNLVKRHRPPYNVRLRDDKSFPYIAVTVADEYPRVMFTRERHRRGTVYFGPYANAKKVRETLDVLNRVFQFRPCEGPKPGRHSGIPCLDYHIERCTAPCIRAISTEDYRALIDGVIQFLSGETRPIVRELEERMRVAAEEERYEDAARYRNRLFAIESLAQRQAADRRDVGSIDVIGLAVDDDCAAVQVFPLRDGRLIDRYAFHLENVGGQDRATILEGFCLEYYSAAPAVPPEVIVPPDIEETEALAGFLSEVRGATRRGARAEAG